jgi:hypothetical protein
MLNGMDAGIDDNFRRLDDLISATARA